jgi:type I restriction enzyme, S subunit
MQGDSLPRGWKWVTLEQVQHPDKRAIVSGPFGSNIGSRFFVSSGVPVIRGNNLTTDMTRYVDDGYVFLTEEKAKEFKNCEAYANDLVFTAAGTLGQVGIIPPDAKYPRYIISNKQMRARVDENAILPLYAYYWLASSGMVEYITQRNTGSSVPLINLSVLRQLPIPLAPIPEQKAIVRILSALDDKIELNRRMNQTLEAMAQALFKSWFVDFDPVTAKAEGRTPFGMSVETASLFPAEFVDSELGAIPKGWRIVTAGEMVTAVGGTTPSTGNSVFWNGGTISWATPRDLSKLNDPVLLETERKITPAGLKQISSGLLPAGTLLMSSRAPVGYLAISEIPVAINQGFIGMLCNKGVPKEYVLQWLDENMETIISHANGTTFMEISKTSFRAIPGILPPEPLLLKFAEIAGKYHLMVVENLRQSRTLASIRDSLLPRLLSGDVRVKV